VAPEYLNIAGPWQDHVLFQLIKSQDDHLCSHANHPT